MAPSYVSPLLVHEEIPDDAGLAAEELEPTARSWRACAVLAVSVLLSMSTWLSASVVLPYLTSFFRIEADDAPLLTISVQLGFVVCAVAQAVVQLPDRFNCRRLMFSGGLAKFAAKRRRGRPPPPGSPTSIESHREVVERPATSFARARATGVDVRDAVSPSGAGHLRVRAARRDDGRRPPRRVDLWPPTGSW